MNIPILNFITRGLLVGLIAVLSLSPLAVVHAEEAVCTPPPGINSPSGASALAFHYNCVTGMWESDHYIYNPTTGEYTARDPIIFTYNGSTGLYDTEFWVWNAPSSSYRLAQQSVSQPPAGAVVVGAPAPTASISDTGAGSNNEINNDGNLGSANISGTGADSNNEINSQCGQGGACNTLVLNNASIATVYNLLNSDANSGNVMVMNNTGNGSGASGNADVLANIFNLLQSSSSALGSGNIVSFVSNIDGDVNGDLLFDPTMLGAVQPAGGGLGGSSDITINNSVDAAINNNIDLAATSGDVVVSQNTGSGSATSGSAKAIANVVNLINSAISSGQSFIGTVNINGNLNGDILVPPDLIEQLIATNVPTVTISMTGANSNNEVNNNGSSTTDITNTNNQGITNNVDANACTGTAEANYNTGAGSATTGDANTSITAFNLTGSNVIGANSILVFVNVVGEWVGMIVNAPQGATAAQFGGGITSNISETGSDSNNTINNNTSSDTNIDNTANQTITNNINADACSGDASANYNTGNGRARSGDADVAVNLLNVQNSSLSLSNWFGILFINVFGRWNGSFGVNTSAGDPVVNPFIAAAGGAGGISNVPPVFSFVPRGSSEEGAVFSLAAANLPSSNTNASVLAATHAQPGNDLQSQPRSFIQTAAIIMAFTAVTIIADAYWTHRKQAKTTTQV
jgi:hypothetical protein